MQTFLAKKPVPTRGSRDRALHIVHGVFALDVGGLERIVLDLVRAGSEAGHRVSVVCVERPGVLATEIESVGGNIISLEKPPGRPQETVDKAASLFAKFHPNVIHTHHIGALWYLGRAARLAGQIPVLHTEHGNHFRRDSWLSCLKTRLFLRRAARFADQFCCVSDEIAQAVSRWRSVPSSKVSVVTNGIDADSFADRANAAEVRRSLGIPPDAPVIGTVGRLCDVKRQDLLLQAAARLLEDFPDLHVLLVGDGPERGKLETLTDTLGIGNRVHFTGRQNQPSHFYQAMDVFALTSRSEGLPVAMLEAWAAGLPVVCSAVGGIPEAVTDGVDGLLFPFDDQPVLCNCLSELLLDRDRAESFGQSGQLLVRQKYSLKQMAKDYERRYRRLIAERIEVG